MKIGEPFGILLGGAPSKPNKGNTIIDAFKVLNLTVSEEQTLQWYIARAKTADIIFSSVGNFKIIPDENNKKKVAHYKKNKIKKLKIYTFAINFLKLLQLLILEGTARYAGLLLAPAEGFGLRPRLLLPFGQKKSLLCCFGPFLAIFGVQ